MLCQSIGTRPVGPARHSGPKNQRRELKAASADIRRRFTSRLLIYVKGFFRSRDSHVVLADSMWTSPVIAYGSLRCGVD
jgi:hypothetical protein